MKLLLPTVFILVFAFAAFGATYTVTRTDDRNSTCNSGIDCSLSEAVTAANATAEDDTIIFALGLRMITLTNQISISKAGTLTINGTGANVLTIDGGAGENRIFYINLAAATISNLTLTGGNGQAGERSGGAILAYYGTLILDRVHITDNSASASGGGVRFKTALTIK